MSDRFEIWISSSAENHIDATISSTRFTQSNGESKVLGPNELNFGKAGKYFLQLALRTAAGQGVMRTEGMRDAVRADKPPAQWALRMLGMKSNRPAIERVVKVWSDGKEQYSSLSMDAESIVVKHGKRLVHETAEILAIADAVRLNQGLPVLVGVTNESHINELFSRIEGLSFDSDTGLFAFKIRGVNPEEFSEDELRAFEKRLMTLCGQGVEFIEKKEGSVELIFKVPADKIPTIVEAVDDGYFSDFNVADAWEDLLIPKAPTLKEFEEDIAACRTLKERFGVVRANFRSLIDSDGNATFKDALDARTIDFAIGLLRAVLADAKLVDQAKQKKNVHFYGRSEFQRWAVDGCTVKIFAGDQGDLHPSEFRRIAKLCFGDGESDSGNSRWETSGITCGRGVLRHVSRRRKTGERPRLILEHLEARVLLSSDQLDPSIEAQQRLVSATQLRSSKSGAGTPDDSTPQFGYLRIDTVNDVDFHEIRVGIRVDLTSPDVKTCHGQPVAGDFDSDGFEETWVFRYGTGYLDVDIPGCLCETQITLGLSTDFPIAGAMHGDDEKVGVSGSDSGHRFLDSGAGCCCSEQPFRFGLHDDLPVAGNWDCDGTDDFNDGDAWFPELWDPATNEWTILPLMQIPRVYHSTAALLPDGRILVGGGGQGASAVGISTSNVVVDQYANALMASRHFLHEDPTGIPGDSYRISATLMDENTDFLEFEIADIDADVSSSFGHGWSMGGADPLILEWVLDGAEFAPNQTTVYLANSAGRRVGFTYTETAVSEELFGDTTFRIDFLPDPGVYDTLTFDQTQITRGGIAGALGNIVKALGGVVAGAEVAHKRGPNDYPIFYSSNVLDDGYTRIIGFGQTFGTSWRPLGLLNAYESQEEFPYSIKQWIHLDSESEFTVLTLGASDLWAKARQDIVTPGNETSVRVDSVVYPRQTIDVSLNPRSGPFGFSSLFLQSDPNRTDNAFDANKVRVALDTTDDGSGDTSTIHEFVNLGGPSDFLFRDFTQGTGGEIVEIEIIADIRDPNHFQQFAIANYHQRPSFRVTNLTSDIPLGAQTIVQGTNVEHNDNVVIVADWRQSPQQTTSFDSGIDVSCDLTVYLAEDPSLVSVGAIGSGIAVADNATGPGYIMYSAQNVFSRFSSNPPFVGSSEHLIAVRYDNGQWQYNDNSNCVNFTPVADDRLIATVDFSADTIQSLQGATGQIQGVDQGFITSDLTFTANQWNGQTNAGEFTVNGTFFTTGSPSGTTVSTGTIGSGIAVSHNATGPGYIMYSAQNVFSRFSSSPPFVGSNEHLIAVRYDNGQWQYNNNSNWVNFTPVADDRLIATVNSTAVMNPSEYSLITKEGWVYQYHEDEGLKSVTDLNGNTVTYSEDGSEHSSGASIEFIRDGEGRIDEIRYPGLDSAGQPTTEVLDYVYDSAGYLFSFTNATGETIQYACEDDPAHFLSRALNNASEVDFLVAYEQDRNTGVHRFKQVEDADGNVLQTSERPDLAARRATVRDGNGNETMLLFDERGNVLEEIDAEGNVTVREYGDPNNPDLETRIVDRRGIVTEREYDSRGNVLLIREMGNADTPFAGPRTTSFTYDADNRVQSITNAAGQATFFDYDGSGNLVKIVNALGDFSTFTYDGQGRRATFTDFNGNETRFTYADRDQPSRVNFADGTYQTFEYDQFGQVTAERFFEADRTLVEQKFTWHDESGRVTHEFDGETTDGVLNQVRRFYDAKGSLDWEVIVNPDSLDGSGNLTESPATLVAQRLSCITDYEYDKHNRLIRQTDAEGGVVEFRYDNESNRVLLQDLVGNITTWGYDALNRVVEEREPLYNEGLTVDQALAELMQESGVDCNTNTAAEHVRLTCYDAEGIQAKTSARLREAATVQVVNHLGIDFVGNDRQHTRHVTEDGTIGLIYEDEFQTAGFVRRVVLEKETIVALAFIEPDSKWKWLEFAWNVRMIDNRRILNNQGEYLLIDDELGQIEQNALTDYLQRLSDCKLWIAWYQSDVNGNRWGEWSE